MKNIFEKIKNLNKGKRYQIIISSFLIFFAIVVAIFNIIGFIKVPIEQLLNIIIILLSSVAVIYVIEEIDVFEEIKTKVMGVSDSIATAQNIIENEKNKLESVQNEIKNVGNELAEVHKLVKDTHTTKGVIVSRKILERNKSLDEVWDGAEEVYLFAIANTSFLRGNGISKIKEAINKGVKFKLVSLNPCYDAIKEYNDSGIISQTSIPVGGNVNAYINNCKNSNSNRNGKKREENNFKTMVELRLTTYLLPYSMMIVKKNGKISTIKVDLYGLDMEYTERRSFYIPAEDEENIKFYEEQWNTVWDNKEKTISVDLTKEY